MSRERRHIEITFVVNKSEHLPPSKDGEQMYADDVVIELRDFVQAAVAAWYQARGRQLLDTQPLTL